MASARTSYRKAGGVDQETLDHIVEALKYAYWGAKNYNLGGVGPFLANIASEPLKSNLPIEALLPSMEDKIQSSYQELTSWINSERKKRGIDEPDVPKAVKNDYEKYLAISKEINSNEMKILSELNITNDNVFADTACVNQYIQHSSR